MKNFRFEFQIINYFNCNSNFLSMVHHFNFLNSNLKNNDTHEGTTTNQITRYSHG